MKFITKSKEPEKHPSELLSIEPSRIHGKDGKTLADADCEPNLNMKTGEEFYIIKLNADERIKNGKLQKHVGRQWIDL